MTQNEQKKALADKALDYLRDGIKLGIGTGSTVNFFIDALAASKIQPQYIASSSEATTKRLKEHGLEVQNLNYIGELDLYIDSCDEINALKQMIKGGGGALTREKILACAAKQFICIADSSKKVQVLGRFPLPVEVIPMARSFVGREIVQMGGVPEWRDGFVTDNGHWIIDVHRLDLAESHKIEAAFNRIPGVVCVGMFADRPADIAIVADSQGNLDIF